MVGPCLNILPTGNFKWLTQKQIEKTNLDKYTENSKKRD